MSGHNALYNLNEDQQGTTMAGRAVLVRDGNPGSSDTGYAKGALCIRTDCTAQVGNNSTALWVNIGDGTSPDWKAVYLTS